MSYLTSSAGTGITSTIRIPDALAIYRKLLRTGGDSSAESCMACREPATLFCSGDGCDTRFISDDCFGRQIVSGERVMYCSKCGRQIPEGGSFCPHCGTPVGGNTEGGDGTLAEEIGKTVDLSEPVKPAPPGRFQLTRDRGKLCVLVSAAVAVAAVVMLLFAFRSPAATLKRQMDIGSRYLKEENFEQAVMA